MKIKTNNRPRDLLSLWELTEKERSEFDYVDEEDGAERFVRYRGNVYDINEYMRVTPPGSTRYHPTECQEPAFQGWQGYQSDSFFSGTLVRYVDDCERVVMATYYC